MNDNFTEDQLEEAIMSLFWDQGYSKIDGRKLHRHF